MGSKNYDVVISGIGGIFPDCENLDEFETKLMNMDNLISMENEKWVPGLLNVPTAIGKFKTICALDNRYFGIHDKLYDNMDEMTGLCLKCSFEAICDAGLNPFSLSSDTAVIMSSSISEAEYEIVSAEELGFIMLGNGRCMVSNRISYFFNFKGPSVVVNGSWTGGLQALEEAYKLISSGRSSAALVGAVNALYGPEISVHFQSMGMLNNDGKTKSFSADADGWTRSEACVVLLLQRAEDAKRSYGNILNVLTINYGARLTPYTDFNPDAYKDLLSRVYNEAKLDPKEVSYIEADGSGLKRQDALELNSISEVFCTHRTTPLAVGSVKSNAGHTEAASSLVSIVKVLMAFKSGFISPNLHYTSPNPDVPALLSGQMEVITAPTPLNGSVVGVSSIGLSGSYGHAIIKQNRSSKNHLKRISSIPMLFIISGRREDALENVIENIESMPFNEDFLALTHNVFKTNIKGHLFRGYSILNGGTQKVHEIKPYEEAKQRPIWFLFSGMGSQWVGMGVDLMRLPTFAKAINLCHDVLLPKGINLLEIINSTDPHIYDSILNSFIGIAAIQIGLVDVLKMLGVEPDGIIGHSVGELGCAYADGCFTAEQMILSAYARGKSSLEVPLVKGMMAAIGLGYNQIKDQLPSTIEVACHNSKTSCTLSGPAEDMEQFVDGLHKKGIFAKLVNVANIAYHSRYIKPAAPLLLKYLQQVIPEPQKRTKRWISSSVPKSSWRSDLAKFSSAEYHTNNLLNPVLFEEASAHIPNRAIVIEIAPRGLLQAIVKKSLTKCSHIPLVERFEKDTLVHLFKAIGRLYLEGIKINIENFYPKTEFPVSGNIPSVGPLLTWDEKVRSPRSHKLIYGGDAKSGETSLNVFDRQLEKYIGQTICGKKIIQSTALLWTVIHMFKKLNDSYDAQRHFISIENVRIQKLLDVEANSNAEINFQFQRGSGEFEINLNVDILASGRMNFIDFETNNKFELVTPVLTEKKLTEMYHDEIYEYFERFSVEFNDNYKLIQKISFNLNELIATIQWKGDLVEFLDAVFMVLSLYDTLKDNELKIVHYIRQICVNTAHFESLHCKEISVFYNRNTKDVSCEGLKILLPLTESCNINPKIPELTMETCQFLPYLNCYNNKNLGDITDCLQIIFQNILGFRDNPKRLTIISYQDYANLLNTLFIYCNVNNHQVDIVTSPTEDTVDDLYINFQKKDNLFIIGEPLFYKRMFKCSKKVTAAFILLKDQSNFEKLNEIYPLIKIKLNGELFILYKMCYKKISEINTITMHYNSNWKSELKTHLKNETPKKNALEILYLVSNIKSLSNIYKTVKFCRSLENNEIIRLVFVDDKSPPFSPNQSFYKKQIILDLVMNIYINGTWGCLNLMTHMFDKFDTIPQNVQPKTIYPLSSIVSENVKLISLGLNLCDIAGSPNDQELGVFDYCGVDKNGNFICGIGTLKDNKKLIEDKILRWQKPESWSYEEAASIPLCYSIAYYIMRMKCEGYFLKMDRIPRILVHRGCLLISQAILHVALKMECEVITTYTTDEEKNLIHQLFPNIDEKNIITGKNSIPLLKSKNSGVDIVINTTDDYSILKYSFRALRSRGCLFQLNKGLMKEGYTIGMSVFLNEGQLAGLSPEHLLELPASTKETIQKEVQIAISEGHIKPLRTTTILKDALNVDAVKLLNTPSTGYSQKVVTKMEYNKDETLNQDTFICSGQKTYLIISNENKFWLDLVNWLLCRGAVTIHILLTAQKLAVTPAQRLKSILSNHPSAKILLHPKKILSVSSDLKQFLKKLNDLKIISEIFIIGEEMEEEVNIMDTMLKQTNINGNLICIGSGGETVCELRNKNNIPALAISCEVQLMKGSIILPELDRIIIKKIKENAVIFVKEKVFTINQGFPQNKLPNDLTELLELRKKSLSKACFVELNASCAPCKHNKEVNPIFIISSLKPNEMDKLTSRLFYPTYEARLPHDVDDIDIMAKQLYEDMKQFKFNIYTIITNGWGSILSLKLIKYLEDDGKIVLLIMLDNTPYCVEKWVSAINEMGDNYLINRYVKLPYKIKKKLSHVSNWNDKLDIALRNYDKSDKEIEEIRKGLNLLRNCLQSIKKCDFNDLLFQGKCFIYRCNDSIEDDLHNFNKHCKRKPVIINGCNEGNLQDFLDDPEMAKKINRLIPFEYPAAVSDLDCETLGVYERDSVKNRFFQTV